MEFSLSQRMLRTAGLFQGLVALPTMIVMGNCVFNHLFYYSYYRGVYNFITATFNALMSAAIVFIILIQRYPITSRNIRLYLEIAKSSCATAVWLWLLLDSIFGPHRGYYYPPNPPPSRTPRIISSALSSVVLIFLFYPTLIFTIIDKSSEGDVENPVVEGGDAEADEHTPLLPE